MIISVQEKFCSRPSSMISVGMIVVRRDGVFGLWRGLSPALLRAVPGIGIYFGFMHSLKTILTEGKREMTFVEAGLVGAASRTLAGLLLMPATVLKTQFESGLFEYKNVFQAFSILSERGVRSMFAGAVPTLVRDVPFAALYLALYTQAKKVVIEGKAA
ncbi:unnamed protein product [Notodromas monacha]|uniref:Solute carrier family 25 member 38 n=1 Tax=Notodromas monacha TaxID=399045 RepID=A0A7R9GES6_9CRUS|nr:unnamed protein product [Notodromas monacha]CAG0918577.1 unnamed protein product [Notodromas monacha]